MTSHPRHLFCPGPVWGCDNPIRARRGGLRAKEEDAGDGVRINPDGVASPTTSIEVDEVSLVDGVLEGALGALGDDS
ncbi:hypothetical protein Tco_0540389 [Tanacetum coccineum]